MAIVGRTERRLAFAILLTAVIPLIVAIYFASSLVDRAFAQAFTPEIGEHLDGALGVYQDLAKAVKDGMRHQADAIAAREPLRAAALLQHEPSAQQELDAVFARYPNLLSLGITRPNGTLLASKDRGRPLDGTSELKLEVRRPLGDGEAPQLIAVFSTPRARFDELERTSEFVRAYHQIERARVKVKRGDLYAFAVILALTIAVAVTIGTLLARSVTRRIGTLAVATQAVAQGDLTVRVVEQGNDELTDLSRAFNRMLAEVEANRARIEFLQRMGTWQEMARRLAHEIKNPLTPILLAVEECHRKYDGKEAKFRSLLDTTLEVVEEEVGTLRRLVGEFSSFARLPRAELSQADLAEFLRDQVSHVALVQEELEPRVASPGTPRASITWNIPSTPMPANIDRQMLHQVVSNIVRNALQAVMQRNALQAVTPGGRPGKVVIGAHIDGDAYAITFDDDGPGVPEDMRETVFDPYVTTRSEGTGLGLAIVKKIVVEHGGTIDVGTSALGGARFRLRIPQLTSAAARAAREMRTSSFRVSR